MQSEREKLERKYGEFKKHQNPKSHAHQKEYAFRSNGSAYRAHVYCVYEDPEFQAAIKELRSKLEKHYYKGISLETSRFDTHILPDDRIPIKKVADEFYISLEDLAFYADGSYDEEFIGFGKDYTHDGGYKLIDVAEHEIRPVYVIGRYTSLEDIIEEWRYVRAMADFQYSIFGHDDNTRRKRSPNYPELIYAVFKARKKKKTYGQIFRDYSDGTLEMYSGNNSVFNSEDSLERYYRKYKPIQQRNLIFIEKYERDAFHHSLPDLPRFEKTDT